MKPLIVDPAGRAAREARIRAEYRPRSWAMIGAQLIAETHAIADGLRAAGDVIPAPPRPAPRKDALARGRRGYR